MDRVMVLRMQSDPARCNPPDLNWRFTFVLFGTAILVVAREWEDGEWKQGKAFLNWNINREWAEQDLIQMVSAREELGSGVCNEPRVVDFGDLPYEEGMLGLYPHEIAGWWESLEMLARKEQLPPNDGGVYDIAVDFLLNHGRPV